MNESILTSIKAQLGIQEEYTAFDQQIVMHINSVLMVLKQLGVGPVAGFVISDKTAIWRDFLPSDKNLEATKSYIGMKVKMLFDKYKAAYDKRTTKAGDSKVRYIKAKKKAERWTRAMNKTFKNYKVSDLPEKQVNSGRDFLKSIK